MASSSGNSSMVQSGSDGELQVLMDQRKRKRMQSNRESARRSRMRKQNHLEDLSGQVAQLSKDNTQILTSINITTQHLMNIEAENQILRAQMAELNQRLQSLNEILSFIGAFDQTGCEQLIQPECFINPFNMIYLNQPIMASADMFQY